MGLRPTEAWVMRVLSVFHGGLALKSPFEDVKNRLTFGLRVETS